MTAARKKSVTFSRAKHKFLQKQNKATFLSRSMRSSLRIYCAMSTSSETQPAPMNSLRMHGAKKIFWLNIKKGYWTRAIRAAEDRIQWRRWQCAIAFTSTGTKKQLDSLSLSLFLASTQRWLSVRCRREKPKSINIFFSDRREQWMANIHMRQYFFVLVLQPACVRAS